MKKVIALLLICTVLVVFVACGNNATSNDSSEATDETASESVESSEETLNKALENIHSSYELIVEASSHQLDGWTKYSDIMEYYFIDEAYNNATETTIKTRAKKIDGLRDKATEMMSEAKELLGNGGSGDYYDALKNYYMSVNKFLTLISTFPEGYSQLTFQSTVAGYKSECESAYEEAAFYN